MGGIYSTTDTGDPKQMNIQNAINSNNTANINRRPSGRGAGRAQPGGGPTPPSNNNVLSPEDLAVQSQAMDVLARISAAAATQQHGGGTRTPASSSASSSSLMMDAAAAMAAANNFSRSSSNRPIDPATLITNQMMPLGSAGNASDDQLRAAAAQIYAHFGQSAGQQPPLTSSSSSTLPFNLAAVAANAYQQHMQRGGLAIPQPPPSPHAAASAPFAQALAAIAAVASGQQQRMPPPSSVAGGSHPPQAPSIPTQHQSGAKQWSTGHHHPSGLQLPSIPTHHPRSSSSSSNSLSATVVRHSSSPQLGFGQQSTGRMQPPASSNNQHRSYQRRDHHQQPSSNMLSNPAAAGHHQSLLHHHQSPTNNKRPRISASSSTPSQPPAPDLESLIAAAAAVASPGTVKIGANPAFLYPPPPPLQPQQQQPPPPAYHPHHQQSHHSIPPSTAVANNNTPSNNALSGHHHQRSSSSSVVAASTSSGSGKSQAAVSRLPSGHLLHSSSSGGAGSTANASSAVANQVATTPHLAPSSHQYHLSGAPPMAASHHPHQLHQQQQSHQVATASNNLINNVPHTSHHPHLQQPQQQQSHLMLSNFSNLPQGSGVLRQQTKEPAYHPQVEAISPAPEESRLADAQDVKLHHERNQIAAQLETISADLIKSETHLRQLREREAHLATQVVNSSDAKKQESKPAAAKIEVEDVKGGGGSHPNGKPSPPSTPPPPLARSYENPIQAIITENRRQARTRSAKFTRLCGPLVKPPGPYSLPLYRQPSDLASVRALRTDFSTSFKPKLLAYIKKRRLADQHRTAYLSQQYKRNLKTFTDKMERMLASGKRKQREAKSRDIFERIIPEVKRAREEREGGPSSMNVDDSSSNNNAAYIENVSSINQIDPVDELNRMKDYAIDPPVILAPWERRHHFICTSALVTDCTAQMQESLNLSKWTPEDRRLFRERYLITPKNFTSIASHFPDKTVADCVHYYYMSKKTEKYKLPLKKSVNRKRRLQQPPPPGGGAGASGGGSSELGSSFGTAPSSSTEPPSFTTGGSELEGSSMSDNVIKPSSSETGSTRGRKDHSTPSGRSRQSKGGRHHNAGSNSTIPTTSNAVRTSSTNSPATSTEHEVKEIKPVTNTISAVADDTYNGKTSNKVPEAAIVDMKPPSILNSDDDSKTLTIDTSSPGCHPVSSSPMTTAPRISLRNTGQITSHRPPPRDEFGGSIDPSLLPNPATFGSINSSTSRVVASNSGDMFTTNQSHIPISTSTSNHSTAVGGCNGSANASAALSAETAAWFALKAQAAAAAAAAASSSSDSSPMSQQMCPSHPSLPMPMSSVAYSQQTAATNTFSRDLSQQHRLSSQIITSTVGMTVTNSSLRTVGGPIQSFIRQSNHFESVADGNHNIGIMPTFSPTTVSLPRLDKTGAESTAIIANSNINASTETLKRKYGSELTMPTAIPTQPTGDHLTEQSHHQFNSSIGNNCLSSKDSSDQLTDKHGSMSSGIPFKKRRAVGGGEAVERQPIATSPVSSPESPHKSHVSICSNDYTNQSPFKPQPNTASLSPISDCDVEPNLMIDLAPTTEPISSDSLEITRNSDNEERDDSPTRQPLPYLPKSIDVVKSEALCCGKDFKSDVTTISDYGDGDTEHYQISTANKQHLVFTKCGGNQDSTSSSPSHVTTTTSTSPSQASHTTHTSTSHRPLIT